MTDVEKLKEKISESELTMVRIAEEAGVVRETLYHRLSNGGDFKISEIEGLSKALGLTKKERGDIFFAPSV